MTPPEKPKGSDDMTPPEGTQGGPGMMPPQRTEISSSTNSTNNSNT